MKEPKKYRKKPVIIEAMQWSGHNWCEIDKFITETHQTFPKRGQIVIPTKEGDMIASLGDWIIKGVEGEFYPCKPDIFIKTYEDPEKLILKMSEIYNLGNRS